MTPSSNASSTRRSAGPAGMPAAIRSRPFTASWLTRQHTPSASSCRARCAARAQAGAACGCSAAHSAHSRSTVHSPYRPKSCRIATSPACAGVSPRTVRWGGTLLPQAVGRAMEWPATATTAACGGNKELLLGQRPAGCECCSRHEADAGCRNPNSCPRRKLLHTPVISTFGSF